MLLKYLFIVSVVVFVWDEIGDSYSPLHSMGKVSPFSANTQIKQANFEKGQRTKDKRQTT